MKAGPETENTEINFVVCRARRGRRALQIWGPFQKIDFPELKNFFIVILKNLCYARKTEML